MDAELIKIINRAVRDGLTSASGLVILIVIIGAGVGSFLGSYLKSKGEHLATKEDFDELLGQIKAQTAATEEIKGEIQQKLDRFSGELQRGREFAGFRRDRIAQHLDQVLGAYSDIYSVAQLIPLRLWLSSNKDLETEARFRTSLSILRTHFRALESLNVIPDQLSREFAEHDWPVLSAWDEVLSEAALRTHEFKQAHPGDKEFSPQQYHQKWLKFMSAVEAMGRTVKTVSRDVSLPT